MEGIVVEIIEKYLEAELAKQQRKYLRLKYDEDAKYYFQNGYSEDAALHADTIISFWTIYSKRQILRLPLNLTPLL